jgi:exosortase/archaeosortase family protein
MIKQFFTQKIKDQKKAESVYFVFSVVSAYLIWKGCSFLLETVEPHWWISLQNGVAALLIQVAVFICEILFSIPSQTFGRNIFIPNTSGIYVANHCLGIPAMVVFSLIILSFGGSLKHKLWYIPIGITGILFINCMRIVGLVVLMQNSSPFFWELNHKYTLLILTYGFIFWMVKVWMDKFADND